MEKKASDFRYNTGETKVPWAAVGENYNAQDLMTIIRFMMKGKGEAYDEALKTVGEGRSRAGQGFRAPAKLSLDVEVGKAENMCDEYLHTTGSTFLTNCTAGFEIACKYTGLKQETRLSFRPSRLPQPWRIRFPSAASWCLRMSIR